MLLHNTTNPFHIILNVSFQITFGTLLELVHCCWRVVTVYITGVLAGALTHSVFSDNCLHGASAGVYALIIAHFASILMNWHEMKSSMYQLMFFILFTITDVIHTMYDTSKGVSHLAHLGGGLTGLLIGIGVLRNLRVKTYEIKIWWASVGLYSILIVSAIFYLFTKS